MDDKDKFFTIKCPKCGAEYTLADIFFPEDLLGKPTNVIKDDEGKILFIEGEVPQLVEDWECERCGTDFKVRLDIKPLVEYDKKFDFSDDYSIDLNADDKEVLF